MSDENISEIRRRISNEFLFCSEFHYGPDEPKKEEAHHPNHIEHQKKGTQPPESTFKKLGPSKQRYTILSPRDEL